MLIMRPRRGRAFSVTTPVKSSWISTKRCSIGSLSAPLIVFMMTFGRLTATSKPSRRMVSIKIAIWNSPRPSPGSCRRSRRVRLARPRCAGFLFQALENFAGLDELAFLAGEGELLTMNFMETVGSSTVMRFKAFGASALQIVSPISTSSMPAKITMSPGSTASTSRSGCLVHLKIGGLERAGPPAFLADAGELGRSSSPPR
jgi:hypothetical protein